MPTTTYKGLSVQTAGSNPGTWGAGASTALNEGMIEIVDRNLGGIVTKSLAAGDVTLSATEAQNAIVRLTGVLPTNRVLTSPCQGFYFVENLTTGSFTVTVTNGVSGVTVLQSTRATLIADATNGVRTASYAIDFIPTGTVMLFVQTAAPTGWIKSTTHNNKALRLVAGTVSTGGTVDFTTAFASQPVTGTIGGTAISVSQMPLHGHPFRLGLNNNSSTQLTGGIALAINGSTNEVAYTSTLSDTPGQQIGGTGGGLTHDHSFTGTAINLAAAYVDCIIATRG